MFKAQCVVLLALVGTIRCQMDVYIVGGETADIRKYPYCAYLSVSCSENKTRSWMCGSSIINQDILLTAAHCLQECSNKLKISISAGSALKNRGHRTQAVKYIVHELFGSNNLYYDIGLVKMKNRLTFDTKISRVALMKNPPKTKIADLAGWGLINESANTYTQYLMHLPQTIWTKSKCEEVYGDIGPGTFCAACNEEQFAAPGDSGSALVTNGYIQIGIVSHKRPKKANYLTVYTDVSYYYDWIHHHAQKLYCLE